MANENVEALRQKYMKDVPLGFTAEEIQRMSDDDIENDSKREVRIVTD